MHVNTRRLLQALILACLALPLLHVTGCTTPPPVASAPLPDSAQIPAQVLQPGDVIKITFPGAVSMDMQQQIRRDGKINLSLIGELQAAGKTPADFEKELTTLYANQLVSKEVKVTVVSSSFSVFVTGAVLKPGKIQPDHVLTVLEAVMEAGGFDYRTANTRAVRVIRTHNGQNKHYTVDLQAVLDGQSSQPFYLQANDVVFVPERFQWF